MVTLNLVVFLYFIDLL